MFSICGSASTKFVLKYSGVFSCSWGLIKVNPAKSRRYNKIFFNFIQCTLCKVAMHYLYWKSNAWDRKMASYILHGKMWIRMKYISPLHVVWFVVFVNSFFILEIIIIELWNVKGCFCPDWLILLNLTLNVFWVVQASDSVIQIVIRVKQNSVLWRIRIDA